MKRIWRWCAAAALLIALVLAATLLAPPTTEAQGDPEEEVGCIIHVFHIATDCEVVRVQSVTDMVAALESYAGVNGTYLVDGSGYLGRGSGWTFWEEAGSKYPVAIATVLTNEGHLPADAARDPLWTTSTDVTGDLLTYRCKDRVAVFSRHSTTETFSGHLNWWTSNNCTTYPIDRLGASYFQVSAPLSAATAEDTDAESARVQSVADMVAALESYASANGTYLVDGTGYLGRGSGWTFWEQAGSTYPIAIATVLVNEGHLPSDAARDPLWSSTTEIEGDLLTYRCHDRVAVFTRHSTTEPSRSDRKWWTKNGCTTYPLTGLNATYFQLSARLPRTG